MTRIACKMSSLKLYSRIYFHKMHVIISFHYLNVLVIWYLNVKFYDQISVVFVVGGKA